MSSEHRLLTPEERDELDLTMLVRHRLEEQFHDLEQQHEVAALGMWVFLATEVMFFGTLFCGLGAYRYQYPEAFERASERLNWLIGGINTVVLLVSSLFMVLARRGYFSPEYYSPVDVTGLYWHFVDVVWIFLLPMLYLLGTHTLADFKIL